MTTEDKGHSVITPNELANGRKYENMYNPTKLSSTKIPVLNTKKDILRRRKHRDLRMKHFFKAWFNEYVTCLQQFRKNSTCTLRPVRPLEKDDVVIINDESLMNFGRMPLGIVEEAIPSRIDGQIRTVRLTVINDPIREKNVKKPKIIARDARIVSRLDINEKDETPFLQRYKNHN